MLPIQTEHHSFGPLSLPPYLIAEIGLNHNGDFDLARRMADAAHANGAHAAKFQLYRSRDFINPGARLGDGPPGSLADFFAQFELQPDEWHRLAAHVREQGLDFFCSVFDRPSLALYAELNARLIKIASCDIDNRMLFEDVLEDFVAPGARDKTRPAILFSTGTSDEAEVERALAYIPPETPRVIFECVSSYPAAPADYNLSVLRRWRQRYRCPVGLSDHTMGNSLSIAAVALGARAIERHFTLDRHMPGPDQSISLDPEDFRRMSSDIAEVFAAGGAGRKTPAESEAAPRKFGRRTIYAAHTIPAGHAPSREDLIAQRPGGGVSPDVYPDVIGRLAVREIPAGEAVPFPDGSRSVATGGDSPTGSESGE